MLNFIVNAVSGKGKGLKTIKQLIDYCCKINVEYTVHFTSSHGHATLIARALCENGARTLVAVGGDGTFHEVLNGIVDLEKTALGFIPSGRGNDFARGIGLPKDPVEAVKLIIENKEKRIDFIDVSGKRCLNVCGTGLDIDVLKRTNGKNGKITYLTSLLYCLKHFKPYRVRYGIDGKSGETGETDGNTAGEKECECLVINVCNGSQYGGGIKVSPESKPDDGLIDVIVMTLPENQKILPLLPSFVKGKHMDKPYTKHFLCDKAVITSLSSNYVQLDGEIYMDLPLNCKVVKSGLRTYL